MTRGSFGIRIESGYSLRTVGLNIRRTLKHAFAESLHGITKAVVTEDRICRIGIGSFCNIKVNKFSAALLRNSPGGTMTS